MGKLITISILFVFILGISCNRNISISKIGSDNITDSNTISGIYELDEKGHVFSPTNKSKIYTINTNSYISFNEIEKAKKTTKKSYNGPRLSIQLNDTGTKNFEQLTQNNLGNMLLLIYNNQLIMSPVVQQSVEGGKLEVTGISESLIDEILEFLK